MNILNLEPNSGAAAMTASHPRRSQWQGYARYHQSRSNLLLHIVFVPSFLAGNVALLVALLERSWPLAIGAVAVTALSLAIQGARTAASPCRPSPSRVRSTPSHGSSSSSG